MTTDFERDYLRSAGSWLACRWTVMGGQVDGWPAYSLVEWLIADSTEQLELKLILLEALEKLSSWQRSSKQAFSIKKALQINCIMPKSKRSLLGNASSTFSTDAEEAA
jgi:hypothetical protein